MEEGSEVVAATLKGGVVEVKCVGGSVTGNGGGGGGQGGGGGGGNEGKREVG